MPAKLRFAAIGLNHGHIYMQVDRMVSSGGELVAYYAKEDDLAAEFGKRYPDSRRVSDKAAILEDEMEKGAFPFVLHCFSSGMELARRGLALGGYLSFSGILTFKNAPVIQDVAKMAPADRILVETDAPYLAPVPHRGRTNEPGFVLHTAEKLAELRGVPLDEIGRVTTENFYRLFSRAKPA